MADNLENNLSISEIAIFCNVGTTFLKQTFQKYAGISVHKFYLRLKLRYAVELLKAGHNATEVSIKRAVELAKKCKLVEIKNAEFMDRVQLGHWVKGNAVYDGRDADEWYVIAKENNKVLLLSVDATASSDGPNIKGGWKNSPA